MSGRGRRTRGFSPTTEVEVNLGGVRIPKSNKVKSTSTNFFSGTEGKGDGRGSGLRTVVGSGLLLPVFRER